MSLCNNVTLSGHHLRIGQNAFSSHVLASMKQWQYEHCRSFVNASHDSHISNRFARTSSMVQLSFFKRSHGLTGRIDVLYIGLRRSLDQGDLAMPPQFLQLTLSPFEQWTCC